MMEPELVSIIIPAYNASEFIQTTLQSALSQTYEPIEIIVVDDGSSDLTLRMVESLKKNDSRIRILRQENRGVAAARNYAIREARGEYVAPLDADDVWLPHKIEKQVQRMQERGHSTGLVYTWWVMIDEAGNPILDSPPWRIEGEVTHIHLALNFVGNASVPLIRRSCLEQVGGYNTSFRDNNGQGCEDWDLTLRVAERYQVALVPEYLVGYRQVTGSMSTDFRSMTLSHEMMLENATLRSEHISPRYLKWSRGLMNGYLVSSAFRSGEYIKAISWMLESMFSPTSSLLSPWAVKIILHKIANMQKIYTTSDHPFTYFDSTQ